MNEIFDVDYTPGSIDDTLFYLKKRFISTVFTSTLFTEKKSLVRKNERDYNGHSIHKDPVQYMLTSTKDSTESSTILTYITTAKFGFDAWNHLSELSILHCKKHVSEYDKLVIDADKLSDTIKRSILENIIDGLADLRSVKN